MSPSDHPVPGSWPELSPAARARLVSLARRRLSPACAYAADDVVQDSLVKWRAIDPSKQDRARLEQVIKTVAASYLRSEGRRATRDQRYGTDRSRQADPDPAQASADLRLALQPLLHLARRYRVPVSSRDVVILEALLQGHTMSSAARALQLDRSEVRKSRARWQLVARLGGDGSVAHLDPIEIAVREPGPKGSDLLTTEDELD